MTWRTAAVRANRQGPAQAEKALADAYRSLFADGREEVEMVLTDLATFCGFYAVEAAGVDGNTLNHAAGRRAAFARIFHFLSLSDEQSAALEEAARLEAEYRQG